MTAERREITSLRRPPDGWQPHDRRPSSWGDPHPAYNTLPNRRVADGPREDAESTADLPELTPGLSRLPTTCPHCGSAFLTQQPPLDGDRRGSLTCNTCSRQVAWLKPAFTGAPSRVVPSGTARLPEPATPITAPLRTVAAPRSISRGDGCSPACSRTYGHDPASHEAYGRAEAAAEIQARPTGVVRTGILAVDFDVMEARVNGAVAPVTATELRMLCVLATNLGRAMTRFEVATLVWGREQAEIWESRGSQSSAFGTFLTRLRQHLGQAAALVETLPGKGVKLRKEPPVDDAPSRPRPRLRTSRLHHRLAARPGRTGGLILARPRSRGIRRGEGLRRPPFRTRSEDTAMSASNGTANVETVEAAVTVQEVVSATQAVAQIPPAQISPLEAADRWYADVVRMRDALAEEEAELAARLDRIRARRDQLGRVCAIFEEPAPALIAVETIGAPVPVDDRQPEAERRPWSLSHACCVNCGTTAEKHAGNGRCKSCSNYWYRKGEERPAELWSKEQTS